MTVIKITLVVLLLIIVGIVLYIGSIFILKSWFIKAYSDKGIYKNEIPESEEFFLVFVPILNLIGALSVLGQHPYLNRYRSTPILVRILCKLFKINHEND